MIEIVKVIRVNALPSRRLWLKFSDGQEGVADLSSLIDGGGEMVRPLADPAMFERVFVSFGVPTWPNGFDLDAIALHQDMMRDGRLSRPTAAE